MKTKITIAIAATLLFTMEQIFAQRPKEIKNNDVEGLYLTVSDFKQGKLTIPTDNQHKGDRLNLKQFFFSPNIISIEQDKETVFYKDSIFAIKLTNGEIFRFINRTPCLIADTSYMYIYENKTVKTVTTQSGPRIRREDVPVTYYYFSVGNHNSVLTLTMSNLRKYVLTDPQVHTFICNKYIVDEMLQEKNMKTNRFMINEAILSQIGKP